MVFALPAANAPPIRVTTSRRTDGSPRCASNMVGIVVTSSSSMILGLVSANSERATTRTERRPARAGSTFVVAGVNYLPPIPPWFPYPPEPDPPPGPGPPPGPVPRRSPAAERGKPGGLQTVTDGVRPHRPAAAGPGRHHLAQPGHHRTHQGAADRL